MTVIPFIFQGFAMTRQGNLGPTPAAKQAFATFFKAVETRKKKMAVIPFIFQGFAMTRQGNLGPAPVAKQVFAAFFKAFETRKTKMAVIPFIFQGFARDTLLYRIKLEPERHLHGRQRRQQGSFGLWPQASGRNRVGTLLPLNVAPETVEGARQVVLRGFPPEESRNVAGEGYAKQGLASPRDRIGILPRVTHSHIQCMARDV